MNRNLQRPNSAFTLVEMLLAAAIGAALIAATVLLTGEIADRWRLRRRPPAAWVPVAGLGFDGRMLATAVLCAALSAAGAVALVALAGLVATVWAVAALGFWRPADANR